MQAGFLLAARKAMIHAWPIADTAHARSVSDSLHPRLTQLAKGRLQKIANLHSKLKEMASTLERSVITRNASP